MPEKPNAAVLAEAALLAETDKQDEALRIVLPYLNDHPNDQQALFIIGHVFSTSKKPGLALQIFKRASELAPHEYAIWHNLGKCYYECLKVEEAEFCFRRALKLNPQYVNSLDGMGMIGLNRCDYPMAMEYCKRALEVDPNIIESQVNLGMCNLALRNWKKGWEGYNKNIAINEDRREMKYGKELRWDGTKGKTVICYGEQGIGDEISFGSCIPDLIRDSKKVVVDCDGRLKRLFKRSFPQADVYGNRYESGPKEWYSKYEFDYRVSIGSLPQFYRNREEDFPGVPYLSPNPEMAIQWRALFDSLGEGLKVGIAWTGGGRHTGRGRRSVTLETLLPILKQDAHFISLQYQDPGEEIEEFEAKHGIKIHHWPHGVQIYDYDVTTSLISELDLVISVTTTVIHAAGGLGKECWCLVPEKPMWRYGGTGEDFPWAKSVTLYRKKGREWPIHNLAGRLRDRIDASRPQRAQVAVP